MFLKSLQSMPNKTIWLYVSLARPGPSKDYWTARIKPFWNDQSLMKNKWPRVQKNTVAMSPSQQLELTSIRQVGAGSLWGLASLLLGMWYRYLGTMDISSSLHTTLAVDLLPLPWPLVLGSSSGTSCLQQWSWVHHSRICVGSSRCPNWQLLFRSVDVKCRMRSIT